MACARGSDSASARGMPSAMKACAIESSRLSSSFSVGVSRYTRESPRLAKCTRSFSTTAAANVAEAALVESGAVWAMTALLASSVAVTRADATAVSSPS